METGVLVAPVLPLHALEAKGEQGRGQGMGLVRLQGQKLEHVQAAEQGLLLVVFLVALLVAVAVLVSSSLVFVETLYSMGEYPRFLVALGLCSFYTKVF